FAAVGRQLHRDGLAVVLSGSPADAVRCRTVRAGCPDARDLCGRTTLAELAGLIRRATVCVTNDSGPMHVAVALGRPVVAVFGPTSRVRTGPYRQPDAAVSADVPCAPCYLRRQRDCRHAQRCLR